MSNRGGEVSLTWKNKRPNRYGRVGQKGWQGMTRRGCGLGGKRGMNVHFHFFFVPVPFSALLSVHTATQHLATHAFGRRRAERVARAPRAANLPLGLSSVFKFYSLPRGSHTPDLDVVAFMLIARSEREHPHVEATRFGQPGGRSVGLSYDSRTC